MLAAGGLHIIGTERHESRRIDNQLRGRSGRQGDPGSSRFYLSLEDNLLRIFGGEGLVRWMKRFGMKDDDALEDRMISRQIEKAQRKVEQHNFDIRKHLLEFDDVANDQRKVIYRQRDELLDGEDVAATVADIREDVVQTMVRAYVPDDSIDDQWDLAGLDRELESELSPFTRPQALDRAAVGDRRGHDPGACAWRGGTNCSRRRKRRSVATPCASWKSM